MKTEKEIREKIKAIQDDYKHVLTGEVSNIQINAPRALMQVEAESLLRTLKWVLDDPYFGLSVRAANCCYAAKLRSRSQIEAAIKDGRLHPMNTAGCRNYGWKTHVEIHKWLGLPEPQRAKPQPKKMP